LPTPCATLSRPSSRYILSVVLLTPPRRAYPRPDFCAFPPVLGEPLAQREASPTPCSSPGFQSGRRRPCCQSQPPSPESWGLLSHDI
jgi:hypothetical protein